MPDCCQYENCPEVPTIRGFCTHHYQKLRHLGQISIRIPATPLARKLSKVLCNIRGRCGSSPTVNKFQYYGGRGIKTFLTADDLLKIWERDSASQMRCPSIDRINVDGDYTKDNCRFVEFDENRRHKRKSRPNNTCVICGCMFFSGHPNAKHCGRCGDDLKHPERICSDCGESFRVGEGGTHSRCTSCKHRTKFCGYCSKSITRTSGSGTFRNEHWFCSKREFGFWLALRAPP